MFIFHRARTGSTEVFNILVPERGLPNALERFGDSLKFSARDERYHDVGLVILIHGDDQVEYVLMCKDGLAEAEMQQLDIELEHLAGREIHTVGTPLTRGWFAHDGLAHES